mmetsp:Transcript_826/g.1590  ORF Transcript_826/g.1590 Transcript_826/m.1590 type:complete len:372 (+) Transcript_826:76-1191(+)
MDVSNGDLAPASNSTFWDIQTGYIGFLLGGAKRFVAKFGAARFGHVLDFNAQDLVKLSLSGLFGDANHLDRAVIPLPSWNCFTDFRLEVVYFAGPEHNCLIGVRVKRFQYFLSTLDSDEKTFFHHHCSFGGGRMRLLFLCAATGVVATIAQILLFVGYRFVDIHVFNRVVVFIVGSSNKINYHGVVPPLRTLLPGRGLPVFLNFILVIVGSSGATPPFRSRGRCRPSRTPFGCFGATRSSCRPGGTSGTCLFRYTRNCLALVRFRYSKLLQFGSEFVIIWLLIEFNLLRPPNQFENRIGTSFGHALIKFRLSIQYILFLGLKYCIFALCLTPGQIGRNRRFLVLVGFVVKFCVDTNHQFGNYNHHHLHVIA